jgi:DNA polymerase III epsilon subunit-like protein
MRLPPFPFTVLDTETTGFTPRVNRVIEFASMRSENGQVADSYEQLFAIDGEIPPHIRVLTRIKDEALKGKARFEEKREEVRSHIGEGTLIIGQNLGFDLGMLKGEGIDLNDRPWVDTSLLASLVFPELRSYSLGYLSRVLDLDHAPVHRALGDVKATYELFVKIWTRLSELPSDMLAEAKDVMGRSSPGYKILFDALEDTGFSERPSWMIARKRTEAAGSDLSVPLEPAKVGVVQIQEEPLLPSALQGVVNACAADSSARHLIAVKNLEHALKGLVLPEGAQVLHPPFLLLDTQAAARLNTQQTYTVDEAMISLKLRWFSPSARDESLLRDKPLLRYHLALHGGEKDVWNGKLACTDTSEAYVKQFEGNASAYLLDHRQLLSFLREESHIAKRLLDEKTHVVIDDASMLEDTATKAFGSEVSLDDIRAAAQGDEPLMRITDILNLWAEKVRANEDIHFVTSADMDRPETKGILDQLREQLQRTDLTEQTRAQLSAALPALTKENIGSHVIWIEQRQNGTIALHAMPERVDMLLDQYVYERFRTTLLAPPGCEKAFPETVPPKRALQPVRSDLRSRCTVVSQFPESVSSRDLLRNPPPGKTVMLLGSKRVIEQLFVDFTEVLEAQGVTLVCQGLSGGQNRMEAEFIAATGTVLWLLTPWTYEGSELPAGMVDRLILDALPFDHPGAPMMQKRKDHYRSSFGEYAMPRVHHRLFRLLRTFCKQRKEGGEIMVLDKRIHEKDYGRQIRAYVERFGPGEPSKPSTTKKEPVQPTLF